MRVAIVAVAFAVLPVGCAGPMTGMARAQETVQELNSAMRYGRSEVAIEHVAAKARDEFIARHRAWGSALRIADLEVAGVRPKGERDAEAIVRVSWYRPEEQDLRTTTIRQGWHDALGWQLVTEDRVDGDVGLLNEAVVYEAPSEAPARAYFPTVRLTGAGE